VAPSPMTLQLVEELSRQSPAPFPSERKSPAFDHMLAGWHYFSHFTPQANARARTEYEAAMRLAPGDAEPVAMLGWTHWLDSVSGWTADAARSDGEASACADRACGYAPQHPAALSLRGKVRLWRHQHDEAIEDMRKALAAVPDMPYLHFHLADALSWAGQPQEALAHITRALALNPNDHGVFLAVEGFARFLMHDLGGARTALEHARVRNPSYCWIYSTLGSVLHEQGEYELAREMAARARQLNRRLSVDFSRRTLPLRRPQDRARIVGACEANGYPVFAPVVAAEVAAVA
jgi:adenylate cyclase